MGHQYQAVQWNKNKVVYDFYVVGAIVAFIAIYMVVGLQTHDSGHEADPVVLMIRALGACAFTLLTALLAIGPLARLSPRFLPFLYNRRHLGVVTFTVSAAHFGLALLWYHGGGPLNPLVSIFVSNPLYDSLPGFPFEVFGFAAFLILFVMAATSHDFWLNNLSAPVWKALHMLVYPAYFLLVLHIVLGFLMTEKSMVFPLQTVIAFLGVTGLHIYTGLREWRADNGMKSANTKGWIDVGAPMDIPDMRAVIAPLPKGDRVAVFRYGNKIAAVTNACRHQNGPLGEGRIIDGAITCPWHGWQYKPCDGVSPPPFTEKISTYNVKIEGGSVLVDPRPNPPGTKTEPAVISNFEE
ncbi:MAG: Rieske 2Fe-2S domain-containing protein [Marinicaulis sp.]|nr:Rieske 2Fe-2S domain-containing protein [Marinicaulis sp.]